MKGIYILIIMFVLPRISYAVCDKIFGKEKHRAFRERHKVALWSIAALVALPGLLLTLNIIFAFA